MIRVHADMVGDLFHHGPSSADTASARELLPWLADATPTRMFENAESRRLAGSPEDVVLAG